MDYKSSASNEFSSEKIFVLEQLESLTFSITNLYIEESQSRREFIFQNGS